MNKRFGSVGPGKLGKNRSNKANSFARVVIIGRFSGFHIFRGWSVRLSLLTLLNESMNPNIVGLPVVEACDLHGSFSYPGTVGVTPGTKCSLQAKIYSVVSSIPC